MSSMLNLNATIADCGYFFLTRNQQSLRAWSQDRRNPWFKVESSASSLYRTLHNIKNAWKQKDPGKWPESHNVYKQRFLINAAMVENIIRRKTELRSRGSRVLVMKAYVILNDIKIRFSYLAEKICWFYKAMYFERPKCMKARETEANGGGL